MLARHCPDRLPVSLLFPPQDGRGPGWGRLESLTAGGAKLSTLTELARGQALLLSFELAGEPFAEIRAAVVHAETDADGYCLAELDFTDFVQSRALAQRLLEALSR